MNFFQTSVVRLCRSEQAAAREIVKEAWHWGLVENLSPAELLERCGPDVRAAIARAAAEMVERLTPDDRGYIMGCAYPADGHRGLLPYYYMAGLADPPSRIPPEAECRIRPGASPEVLAGLRWRKEFLSSPGEMRADEITAGWCACPCCGARVLTEEGAWELCGVCDWEDDPVQSEDPDYAGGANRESLNEARRDWSSRKRNMYSIENPA